MSTTPLGADVEPDVNCTNARSSSAGGAWLSSAGASSVSRTSTRARSGQLARRASKPGARAAVVTTARAPAARSRLAVSLEIVRQIDGRGRRVDGCGNQAGDRRAEERGQERLGVGEDEGDQFAAPQAAVAQAAGDATGAD